MNTIGIRFSDKENHAVFIDLDDVLEVVDNGNLLHWAILYLWATGDLGEGQSIPLFENNINKSDYGFHIAWEDLVQLSTKFDQVIDIIIIGCRNPAMLRRYATDQEMYDACDTVIEMIDSSYWEIHSKDQKFIEKCKARFKQVIELP